MAVGEYFLRFPCFCNFVVTLPTDVGPNEFDVMDIDPLPKRYRMSE